MRICDTPEYKKYKLSRALINLNQVRINADRFCMLKEMLKMQNKYLEDMKIKYNPPPNEDFFNPIINEVKNIKRNIKYAENNIKNLGNLYKILLEESK